MEFPPAPPPPSSVEKEPTLLEGLNENILYDQEKRQFIFTTIKDGKTEEYQYSFVVNQWILIKNHVMDDHELEEEANKSEIRQIKKRKLEDIRSQKETLLENRNSGIFISNLPVITEEELESTFSSYGKIAIDKGNSPRIKLYYDDNDKFKHEALIIYENAKSVDLAIQIMDKSILKGQTIKVERARFNSDNEEKLKAIKDKFYAKIIVIENMFTTTDLKNDVHLSNDLESDIKDECIALGIEDLVKISLFPQDEIVTVKFKDPQLAAKVIKKFDSRYYDGRRLHAYKYEGKCYS